MTAVEWMVAGAIVAVASLAALFFLRFWRASRDPLFAWFAAAFVLQALARVAPALPLAHELLPYGLRLLSYLLIAVAIWSKNRVRARGARPQRR